MTEKKKNSRSLIIALVVLVVLVLVALICWKFFAPSTSAGDKSVTIEVVDDQGETTSYDVSTDAEYLRGAMDDAEGLTYSGEDSDYGLMIETVNGVTADYDTDGAYWAFYVNDQYCEYGVDEQPVVDGDTFRIEYTK